MRRNFRSLRQKRALQVTSTKLTLIEGTSDHPCCLTSQIRVKNLMKVFQESGREDVLDKEFPMDVTAGKDHTSKPFINVTPLIDVLLVLLIIFMVVTPLKPARIAAKVPSKPDKTLPVEANIKALLVTIKQDRTLMLNGLTDMGSVDDTTKLRETLAELFEKRRENHLYRDEMIGRPDVPEDLRIERTVFIRAPRSITYGEVARVVDGVKGSGATPLGLAIDDLD